MSLSPPNSALEPPIRPDKKESQNRGKNPIRWLSQEIFALEKDESGEEKYRDPTVLGHIILIATQLGLVLLAYGILSGFANYKAHTWMHEFKKFNLDKTALNSSNRTVNAEKSDQITTTETPNNIVINPLERERIVQQFKEIQSRAAMHYNIMIDFYETRYVALSMTLGLASISVLCLIFISRSGWDRIHKSIVNIFIITTALAIFYGDVTNVYQHEDNIAINEVQYESYINLGNYLLSYLVTKNGIDGEPISPEDFIHKIDFIMEEINDIFLTFDNTSIDRRLKRITSVIPEANEPLTDSENNSSQVESEAE